jgi:hypothetical protein
MMAGHSASGGRRSVAAPYRLSDRLLDWVARAPVALVFALVALILAMVFAPGAGASGPG